MPRVAFATLVAYLVFVPESNLYGETALNQLTAAERRGGWKIIFDGTTTNGWRNYRDEQVSDGWVVREGALTRIAKGAGDIITVDQYENFELSIEYRISPGGNSGIMFHVTEEGDSPAHSGPEVQILDNAQGHDSQMAGWLYQLYQPIKPTWAKDFEEAVGHPPGPEIVDATRPAGDWNHVYLRVSRQGEVAMNGVSYFYFLKGDEDWNQRVAKSKFSRWPLFGKASKGHICLQDHGDVVAFRNIKIRELGADDTVPDPVDGQLLLQAKLAFPNLSWVDWSPEDERGRTKPLRLIDITHAGDGSDRLFVVFQDGMIQVIENNPAVVESKMFLDIRPQVVDWNRGVTYNEYGMLGLAFHPSYKDNGYIFVHYSPRTEASLSYISRFKTSDDDPDRADPDSETVIMEMSQPLPNHNGGSLEFGPDGYLYIGMGDGGGRNDQNGLGQDLSSPMGCILRIDVDRKENGQMYAIPRDNPFWERENVRPEIYAYGFRNIWRMAFDRKTGTLWAADVGQDLWEEINIIQSGGNYGWSVREGTHLFGNNSAQPADPPIDPIWEYDHRVGTSITGGRVYRGKRLPVLAGCYLYGDYVSGKIWALKYDETSRKVVQNMSIPSIGRPILAFGEDEHGEVYCLVESANHHGIYQFESTDD